MTQPNEKITNDEMLEVLIGFSLVELIKAPSDERWHSLKALIGMRSPEQVARMEAEKGLA